LTIAGVSVGDLLAADNPMAEQFTAPPGAGSVIAVVATDAPLLPQQCKALARRVTLGLARTGTTGSHFSGDLFLAFSVANPGAITPGGRPRASAYATPEPDPYDQLRFIPWGALDPYYEAVVQATEEAVLNALVAADEMTGKDGHRSPALPRDQIADLFRARMDS
jgi:L-aminopeptidase/D-esterase-like protein